MKRNGHRQFGVTETRSGTSRSRLERVFLLTLPRLRPRRTLMARMADLAGSAKIRYYRRRPGHQGFCRKGRTKGPRLGKSDLTSHTTRLGRAAPLCWPSSAPTLVPDRCAIGPLGEHRREGPLRRDTTGLGIPCLGGPRNRRRTWWCQMTPRRLAPV